MATSIDAGALPRQRTATQGAGGEGETLPRPQMDTYFPPPQTPPPVITVSPEARRRV